FREIFVNHHPDVILTYMREPHRKFVERIHRDFPVHGAVAFYEVAEMRTRADRIVQTTGFSKTSDDLLRVVQSDSKVSIASDSDVMDRLHAFFIALEYLNICDFTIEAGPLKYLSELEEWRHDNRGLAVLLAADSLIRKKEVLTHHKQLWNDARSTAELEKFRQAEHEVSTPTKRPRSRSPPAALTPPKNEARSRKNKARRDRNKALLKKFREENKEKDQQPKSTVKLTEKVERDQRVPEKEWKKIMSFSYTVQALADVLSTTVRWGVGSAISNFADPPVALFPAATDALQKEPTAAQFCSPPPWERWSEVPRDPDLVKALGPWCLEIFSGSAGISAQWRQQNLLVLPPIDLTLSAHVRESVDLLDFVKLLCRMGAVTFLHLGTPCSSFSIARSRPGGPPPLRSRTEPLGFTTSSQAGQWQITLANELLFRSLELFAAVVPQVQQLKLQPHLYNVDLDQCQFGSSFRKPTRFLVSDARFLALARACDGSHQHAPLKGRLRLPSREVVFMTRLAQEYPIKLCELFAEITHSVVFGIFPQFKSSFELIAPKTDRQAKARRGDSILQNIKTIVGEPHCLQQRRHDRLAFWRQRSHALLPDTDRELRSIADPSLRRLLLGVPDYVDLQLGSCTHVKLYDELFEAAGSPDPLLLKGIRDGFPIVGNIERSGRWPPFSKPQQPVPVQDALDRAWEFRSKIFRRCNAVPVSDNLRSLWKATMEDVLEGSTVGPFGSEDEVSEFLGCSDWIPTQRFEVVAKNKVRGCDSATSNLINKTAVITEKLQLVSTDLNVAVLRELWTRRGDRTLDPEDGVPKYFVMIGHSFGLVAAVYNYNRRSAFINDILVKIFEMVAFNFYDAKYGFETELTAPSAKIAAETVHFLLEALFDEKKLQLSVAPVILGVTFNLQQLVLEIKEQRKQELLDTIDSVLESGILVGRAFFRPLSERRYMEDLHGDRMDLNPAIIRSLKYWRRLIQFGPPREISLRSEKPSDVVIFTDGFTPDQRKEEMGPDRVGAVMFDRRAPTPKQFAEVIPREISEK
ncbi:unnamed protein product, partial [Symbiodinium necroappetens]